MRFIDPRKTPFVKPNWRGELPHLYKPAGFYFATYRLLDAVVLSQARVEATPHEGVNEIEPEELLREFDPPVTLGSCALRRPEIAAVVQSAFRHFEGVRYELLAWCVMPNHVHVIFAPRNGHQPSAILQSWKGFTARKINKILGVLGPFWERESFDHLVRSETSLGKFIRYVEANPVAALLCKEPEDWPYSSAAGKRGSST